MATAPRIIPTMTPTLHMDGSGGLWLSDADPARSRFYFALGFRYKAKQKLWAVPNSVASLVALLDDVSPVAGDARAAERLREIEHLHEDILRLQVERDWARYAGDPRLDPYQRAGVHFLRQMHRALLADGMGLGKCLLPTTEVWTDRGPYPIQALFDPHRPWVAPLRLMNNPDGSQSSRPPRHMQGIRVSTLVQKGPYIPWLDDAFNTPQVTGPLGGIGFASIWRVVKRPVTDWTLYTVTVGGNSITASAEHLFWAQTGGTAAWTEAQNLSVGQLVALHPVLTGRVGFAAPVAQTPAWLAITDITTQTYTGDLYDLQVPGSNSFVAEGFVVHNSGQALLAVEHEPVLILAPKSVLSHWEREVEKWLGHKVPDDWTITNYESVLARKRPLPRKEEEREQFLAAVEADPSAGYYLAKVPEQAWGTLIVDEVQCAVNRKAGRTKAITEIAHRSKDVYLLSGTPIRRNYDDLYALLHMLDPDRFGSYWTFASTYGEVVQGPFGKLVNSPDEHSAIGQAKIDTLQRDLYPYMLRREKVVTLGEDLPPKSYLELPAPLEAEQQKAYDELEKDLFTTIETDPDGLMDLEAFGTLAKLIRLRQVCLSLALVGGRATSSRLRQVEDLLTDIDDPTVIFTSFAEFAKLVASHKAFAKYSPRLVIGELSREEREKSQDLFRAGDCQLMVCTIAAAGVGLDFTSSHNEIFTDGDWSAIANSQAEDREWRRGQDHPVNIYRLFAPGTVEEYVWAVAGGKERIANTTLTQREVLRRMYEGRRRK